METFTQVVPSNNTYLLQSTVVDILNGTLSLHKSGIFFNKSSCTGKILKAVTRQLQAIFLSSIVDVLATKFWRPEQQSGAIELLLPVAYGKHGRASSSTVLQLMEVILSL